MNSMKSSNKKYWNSEERLLKFKSKGLLKWLHLNGIVHKSLKHKVIVVHRILF
jgi:hypothetical protein